jgi:hypothetical protein
MGYSYPKARKKWRETHPVHLLLSGARERAKSKGLEYNLKPEDITIPKKCPILGIPLKRNTGSNKHSENSPSLDRFDSNKGYTKENTRVISYRANKLKNDGTVDEFIKILFYLMNNGKTLRMSHNEIRVEVRGFRLVS